MMCLDGKGLGADHRRSDGSSGPADGASGMNDSTIDRPYPSLDSIGGLRAGRRGQASRSPLTQKFRYCDQDRPLGIPRNGSASPVTPSLGSCTACDDLAVAGPSDSCEALLLLFKVGSRGPSHTKSHLTDLQVRPTT